MTTINERVNQVRKQHGLTQQKFAEMLGISRTHIANVENRNDNPSVPVLKLIATKFGVNEQWLLTGEGSPVVPAVPAPNGREQAVLQLDAKIAEFKATSALVERQMKEIQSLLRVLTA